MPLDMALEQTQIPTAPANRLAALLRPRQAGVGGGFGNPLAMGTPSASGVNPASFPDLTIANGPNAATYNRNAQGSITGGTGLSGPAAGMTFSNPAQKEAFESFVNSGMLPGSPGGPVGGMLQNYGRMFGAGLGVDPTGGLMANNPEARDAFLKFAQGQQGLGLQGQNLGLERAKLGWEMSPHKLVQDIVKGSVFQGMPISDVAGIVDQLKQVPGLGVGGQQPAPSPGSPDAQATGPQAPQAFLDWLRKTTQPLDPNDKSLTGKRIFKDASGQQMPIEEMLAQVNRSFPGSVDFSTVWPLLSSGYSEKDIQSFLNPGRLERGGELFSSGLGALGLSSGEPSLRAKMRSAALQGLGKSAPRTKLEEAVENPIRNPWVLNPITLPAVGQRMQR